MAYGLADRPPPGVLLGMGLAAAIGLTLGLSWWTMLLALLVGLGVVSYGLAIIGTGAVFVVPPP